MRRVHTHLSILGLSLAGALLLAQSSSNTVAFHIKHVYEKLHVHSKSEAVAKALRSQIVR
jgi:ATP/maltotriose-dependent transcriptional regulator MalT